MLLLSRFIYDYLIMLPYNKIRKISKQKQLANQEENESQNKKICLHRSQSRNLSINIGRDYKQPLQDQFSKNYTIIKKIGEGANSVVHTCKKNSEDETFVVKIMKFRGEEDQFNEISEKIIHHKISHKNIVALHDYIIDRNLKLSYLIQELIPGKSIQKYIHDKDPVTGKTYYFSENEAQIIVKGILEGLDYLHKLNICHRDLHYGNVLYDHITKSVKVIDFSVARQYIPDQTIMMSAPGSILFQAPELLEKKFYNNKIDIWSAGIIFYSLLYGCLPFTVKDTENIEEASTALLKQELSFPNSRQVSEKAKQFISFLLTKNPTQRPTAEEALKHPFITQPAEAI